MNEASGIHQVVIGALNPSENCFSIGCVEGLTFVVGGLTIHTPAKPINSHAHTLQACAVGADVVILASNLERVQVIPISGNRDEELVSSVSCCAETGKVAACYGSTIRVLEPVMSEGKAGSAKV